MKTHLNSSQLQALRNMENGLKSSHGLAASDMREHTDTMMELYRMGLVTISDEITDRGRYALIAGWVPA